MTLSVDEHRIVNFLRRLADNYERRAAVRVFSYDRVRAALLRKVAQAIEDGRHR